MERGNIAYVLVHDYCSCAENRSVLKVHTSVFLHISA